MRNVAKMFARETNRSWLMTKRKNIKVTRETKSGLNTQFKDPTTGRTMSRAEFADRIESGEYEGYHIRRIEQDNGRKLRVPASNPDSLDDNNLG